MKTIQLSQINILDFEKRVKKYAHPINKGRVTVDQLVLSFEDTSIFNSLRNPYSATHKLLLSPFFRQLPLSHYDKNMEDSLV